MNGMPERPQRTDSDAESTPILILKTAGSTRVQQELCQVLPGAKTLSLCSLLGTNKRLCAWPQQDTSWSYVCRLLEVSLCGVLPW